MRPRLSPVRQIPTTAAAVSLGLLAASVVGIVAPSASAAADEPSGTQLIDDAFVRPAASGWGDAGSGNPYVYDNSAAFSRDGSQGIIDLSTAGISRVASIPSVDARDSMGENTIELSALPVGGNGVYAGIRLRSDSSSYYQAQVRVDPRGRVSLKALRASASGAVQDTLGREVLVPGVIRPGRSIHLEFEVTGIDPVSVKARAWLHEGARPEWQVVEQDASEDRIDRSGAPAVWSYLSSAALAPVRVGIDDLKVTSRAAGSAATPPPPATPRPPTPPVPPTAPIPPTPPASDASVRGASGSAEIGSTAYAVPAGAMFVARGGSDSAAGTAAAPFAEIRTAIDRARSGQTIVIRGGEYRESIEIPRGKSLTIQSYPGEAVWLDGSAVIDQWRTAGSRWVVDDWDARFDSSPTYTRGRPDNPASGWSFLSSLFPMAAHPDQVWIGDTALTQSRSLDDVGVGEFYVDSATERLYVGSDPAGQTVRASDTVSAIRIFGAGSVVRGIGVHRFAPSVPDMGAVTVWAPDVSIENMAMTDNATTGLSVNATGVSVKNVTVARNGMLGMHANYADRLSVVGLSADGNNTEHFNRAPVSGGLKITRSRVVSVVGSSFINNDGNALWFDESVYDGTVVSNDVIGNTGNGIVVELSAKFVVADNVVVDNQLNGILLEGSGSVDIWNNTVSGSDRAIKIAQGDRRASNPSTAGHDPRQKNPDPTVTWITEQISIGNNILAASTGNCVLGVEDYTHERSAQQMGITTDGNVFHRSTASQPRWAVVWSRGQGNPAVYNSLGEFTAGTGQDRRSVAFDGQPVIGADFRPTASVSAAVNAVARPLPPTVAALTGRSGLQLGAWID